jgi:hypothetical protein
LKRSTVNTPVGLSAADAFTKTDHQNDKSSRIAASWHMDRRSECTACSSGTFLRIERPGGMTVHPEREEHTLIF